MNQLIRTYRGQFAAPIEANMRRLRIEIDRKIGGEDNIKVNIYILDELDEPICYQSGKGENELVINIEEDRIEYSWKKKTFWKRTKDFFRNIVESISSVFTSVFSAIGIGREVPLEKF